MIGSRTVRYPTTSSDKPIVKIFCLIQRRAANEPLRATFALRGPGFSWSPWFISGSTINRTSSIVCLMLLAYSALNGSVYGHAGRRFEVQLDNNQLVAQGVNTASPPGDGAPDVRPYPNSIHDQTPSMITGRTIQTILRGLIRSCQVSIFQHPQVLLQGIRYT